MTAMLHVTSAALPPSPFSSSSPPRPRPLHSFPTRRSSDLAFVRAADAARMPQVDVSSSAARGRGLVNGVPIQGTQSLYTAGADLSYEVDRKSTRLNSNH